jgi:hypothetical protein
MDEAVEWFRLRDSLGFTEALSAMVPHQTDRWTELAGLAGSLGEVVSVACAAEVEAQLLADAIAAGELPPPFGLGRRAFGEAEGYFVISAAHKLANWCARALMLARDYPWDGTGDPKALRQRFDVFSELPGHWIFATEGVAVGAIAGRAEDEGVRALGVGLTQFVESEPWTSLYRQRHEDFHRWRYESPYVAGVDKSSAWIDDPEKRVRTLPFGGGRQYTEATGIVDEVCQMAHAALIRLGTAMTTVREGFTDALPFLSEGAFVVNRRADGSVTKVTTFPPATETAETEKTSKTDEKGSRQE